MIQPGAVTFQPVDGAAAWDDAVLGRPDSVPFHGWEFLTACADAWGLRFEPLLVRHGDEVVGGWVRLVRAQWGLRWVNHLNLLNFVGPSVAPDHLGAVLAAAAREDRLRTVRERQEVRLSPELAPEVDGWHRKVATSMVVPLVGRTVEEIADAGGHRVAAEAARRARKYGTVIEQSTEDELRDVLPRLMSDLFARQGLPVPYDATTYLRAIHGVASTGEVRALTARVGGEPAAIAIAMAAPASRTAFEWIAADDSAHRAAGVSFAVRQQLVRWAHRSGYDSYDMLGGTTEGIAAFKRSLGAEPQDYCVYERGLRSVTGD